MNLVQITPGAGGMYCGNCLRDNALVTELRRLGHAALMVPLYLPLTLDEPDQTSGTPVFFGGINVYLDQKVPWFRRAPGWLRRLLTAPWILRRVAGRAASTQAKDVADLTISMLRGEEGNQLRDLQNLISWLGTQPRPDAVLLSNALLIGLARSLRRDLCTRVVCNLQGEDGFLDAMPEPFSTQAWQTLAERAADVDLFIAPSRYFAELMGRRLGVSADRIALVPNGIQLDGYPVPFDAPSHPDGEAMAGGNDTRAGLGTAPGAVGGRASPTSGPPGQAVLAAHNQATGAPTTAVAAPFDGQIAPNQEDSVPRIGYLARMSRDKGLDLLVDAFLELRRRPATRAVRLCVAGGCTPGDEPFVRSLQQRVTDAGAQADVAFHPNLHRAAKVSLLRSLTVFSVPATYSEAFGLYLLEAMAAGVPVVQPRSSAFPELIVATGGGVLCEPGNVRSLTDALESLLLDPERRRALGRAGQSAVWRDFSARRMAERLIEVLARLGAQPQHP